MAKGMGKKEGEETQLAIKKIPSIKEYEPSAVEAWIAAKLNLDPAKLECKVYLPEWAEYKYAEAGVRGGERIFINGRDIKIGKKCYMGYGFGNRKFKAFEAGYEGNEKPSFLHPFLQKYYKKGLEAKASYGLEAKKSEKEEKEPVKPK